VEYVVIVDSYGSVDRLRAEFTKAGYQCVRVQSTPSVPAVYRSAPAHLENYAASIVHDGDLDRTVAQVAAYDPVAVVPGGEVGVEFADRLSEALALPTNGTALSAARRDKHTMVETIRKAGLRAARQLLVRSEAELIAWHREIGGRVVLKPVRSSGGDGIYFCDAPEDSARAYAALSGSYNVFSQPNDAVVAQEYLAGTEYMVNTVSRDGHHRVCDIWRTTRICANGMIDLCDGLCLMAGDGEVAGRLTDYAFRVLDALGIRHGPGHVEIRLTRDGPCLVEAGARLAGGDIPYYASLATGESQLDWTATAYLRPAEFHDRCERPYRVERYCAIVAMISPADGILHAYHGLEEIKQLESFHDAAMLVAPGQHVSRSVNDLTYPIVVRLLHEEEEVVVRDHGTIRQLDGAGFYEVEPRVRGGFGFSCTW